MPANTAAGFQTGFNKVIDLGWFAFLGGGDEAPLAAGELVALVKRIGLARRLREHTTPRDGHLIARHRAQALNDGLAGSQSSGAKISRRPIVIPTTTSR